MGVVITNTIPNVPQSILMATQLEMVQNGIQTTLQTPWTGCGMLKIAQWRCSISKYRTSVCASHAHKNLEVSCGWGVLVRALGSDVWFMRQTVQHWVGKLMFPARYPDSNPRHSPVVLWTYPSPHLSLVLLWAGFTYRLGSSHDQPVTATSSCRGGRTLDSSPFYPSRGLTGVSLAQVLQRGITGHPARSKPTNVYLS